MTYLWPKGEPIRVSWDANLAPKHFVWGRQVHAVEQVVKRWRLDGQWWQGRIFREYFKVTTQTGLLVVLYLDWQTGQWYLQRLYD